MNRKDQLCEQFLDFLEDLELPLLSWGIVDQGFSEDELLEHAETFLEEQNGWESFRETDELVDALERRNLLFSSGVGRGRHFSTRAHETLRLLTKLRQLFPGHLSEGTWASAHRLVADFRFISRARAYPRRDRTPPEVREFVLSSVSLSRDVKEALKAFLGKLDDEGWLLSGFQEAATRRVLDTLESEKQNGTVIASGTGSGKTLAFYLPALVDTAAHLDSSNWVKCLAIYPRTELLKDQFSEVFKLARTLDPYLRDRKPSGREISGYRRVRMGALYGDIPVSAEWVSKTWDAVTDEVGAGYRCPFLVCPDCKEPTPTLWTTDDVKSGREQLRCSSTECGRVIGPDEIVVTRQRLCKEPPDILFLTTEMLNQRMSDTQYHYLLGIKGAKEKKPRLVLLDEIHTYQGSHGAHVSMLLRRWRLAARSLAQFVGLSATLRDARRFLAELVGLEEYRVETVEPTPKELVFEGREYLVALRGDPISKTGLLSTTIQGLMLMRRMLDTPPPGCSGGMYGSRVLAFTDNLDVTNRLYFDLKDAEGWRTPGRYPPPGPLAALRGTDFPDQQERDLDGQLWDKCELIGNRLDHRLEVGRVSSQDAGVDPRADLIVATASLEVGFDDPRAGAVFQHKAPRDPAQFLQRRGRAGRPRGMRPWTVVVLSDFGRDRIAYQGYDVLFDPELHPSYLPIRNRYIQKIQATYALMDWLSIHQGIDGWVWKELSRPHDVSNRVQKSLARQTAIADKADRVLRDETLQKELGLYLQKALVLSDSDVRTVMWEPPRGLMTSVLPTIYRRLTGRWEKSTSPEDREYYRQRPPRPLPDFVTSNLFSELNLPEVEIILPDDDTRSEVPPMTMSQGMREFAPGRVSKRFSVERTYGDWVDPGDPEFGDSDLAVTTYCGTESEPLDKVRVLIDGDQQLIPCVRPFTIRASRPPKNLRDTTNAFLRWGTEFRLESAERRELSLPDKDWVSKILEHVTSHTNNDLNAVTVSRIAIGSDVDYAFVDGNARRGYVRFVDDHGGQAGVGFRIEADGIRLSGTVPDDLTQRVTTDDATLRAVRSSLFHSRILESDQLDAQVSKFQREWLSQVFLTALTCRCMAEDRPDIKTASALVLQDSQAEFAKVLETIFQVEVGDDLKRSSRLEELAALLNEAHVTEILERNATILWEDPDESWEGWLASRFVSTLGAAFLQAMQATCPEIDSGKLSLDLAPASPQEANSSNFTLWITEQGPGGLGLIGEVLEVYATDPARFWALVGKAVGPSEFEMMDQEIRRFLELATTDEEVSDQVESVRGAASARDLETQTQELLRLLADRGQHVCHPVVVGLNTRVLRKGSNKQTDKLLQKLLDDWVEAESRLGLEIDARVVAYSASRESNLDEALGDLGFIPAKDKRKRWRYGAIYGLLWPRGMALRAGALNAYNPFCELPNPEALLLRLFLGGSIPLLRIDENWESKLEAALLEHGRVRLGAKTTDRDKLGSALLKLQTLKVDEGFLILYPRVTGVDRTPDQVILEVELAEHLS